MATTRVALKEECNTLVAANAADFEEAASLKRRADALEDLDSGNGRE